MMLTKADKWLTGILLVVAAVGILAGWPVLAATGQKVAEVSVNGKVVKVIPLRQGYYDEFRVENQGHYNVIEVRGDRIRIREADCPDQICVRTGWASLVSQQIVCLPNRVAVRIISAEPSDIDDIAR
ncbi:Hypothetical protein LUCI_3122 [Lucifera butyrica]|uniref:Uncharacterized protein n=1 Tax=Lucifera butyrica TaxID=1351585 RepID=A0A498RA87_9FIRM|nr:NusG domain II-containing protein [Lucifera butyrica]VBB07857.1 Hypothetical protein LUCI_3122 [Lucifera butyrica]